MPRGRVHRYECSPPSILFAPLSCHSRRRTSRAYTAAANFVDFHRSRRVFLLYYSARVPPTYVSFLIRTRPEDARARSVTPSVCPGTFSHGRTSTAKRMKRSPPEYGTRSGLGYVRFGPCARTNGVRDDLGTPMVAVYSFFPKFTRNTNAPNTANYRRNTRRSVIRNFVPFGRTSTLFVHVYIRPYRLCPLRLSTDSR